MHAFAGPGAFLCAALTSLYVLSPPAIYQTYVAKPYRNRYNSCDQICIFAPQAYLL